MPHSDIPFSGANSESPRPQADPLPLKRGEIGYVEALEPSTEASQDTTPSTHVLPARHPADRDYSSVSPDAVIPPVQSESGQQPSSTASITAPITKSHVFLDLFKAENSPIFGGFRIATLLIFAMQLALFGGTITAWVFTSKRVIYLTSTGQSLAGQPSLIYVHIVFIIPVLIQLVFLERRLFRLRGERYSYVHAGEILPRHRTNIPQLSTALAFAPWNRPPLPTYAATLAQSGVGTGDAEDHLIAALPPPAYGNTRGSTLLLSGFLRDSLRAPNRNSNPAVQEFGTDRPLSYVSRDEQVQDPERARRIEETLSQLQSPSVAHITGRNIDRDPNN